MYGVIIKESKGYFIPYTFEHFDKKEYNRLTRAFREECLFTKAGNGELSSDEFLSLLGYPDPAETMRDYLTNFLTFDQEFLWFAEHNYQQYDFVLFSNDVKEWSKYLFELYGLQKYFKPKFPRPLYLGGRGKLYFHSLKNKLLPRSNLSKQLFSILKYDHF